MLVQVAKADLVAAVYFGAGRVSGTLPSGVDDEPRPDSGLPLNARSLENGHKLGRTIRGNDDGSAKKTGSLNNNAPHVTKRRGKVARDAMRVA
jgi:hypothetical protein